jgi:hypothetical protein
VPNVLRRLKKEEKAARQLNLSIEDRDRFKIESYHYRMARLIFQDAYVVTFTNDLLIVWELKKIVANKSDGCYKIVQLPEPILGFQ